MGVRMLKVIAQQGDKVFLLLVGEHKARVLDLQQGKLFPAYNLHSILARGYWMDPTATTEQVVELFGQVEILDDYPPTDGAMRVTVFDIDSGDKLATIESRHGTISIWENPDPSCMPTLNPGLPKDFFDHMESWTELVPQKVHYRRKEYTLADGDEFLFALVDAQPSNIVGFNAIPETWNAEKHKEFRRKHYESWEL
jgi:hypothetical protein